MLNNMRGTDWCWRKHWTHLRRNDRLGQTAQDEARHSCRCRTNISRLLLSLVHYSVLHYPNLLSILSSCLGLSVLRCSLSQFYSRSCFITYMHLDAISPLSMQSSPKRASLSSSITFARFLSRPSTSSVMFSPCNLTRRVNIYHCYLQMRIHRIYRIVSCPIVMIQIDTLFF